MVREGLGVVSACNAVICWIRPELSQYPIMVAGLVGRFELDARMYFSRKVNADNIPYPSDRPECASRWVLGEVLAPVQNLVSSVATFHEKALRCCALRDASLTMIIFPWFSLM